MVRGPGSLLTDAYGPLSSGQTQLCSPRPSRYNRAVESTLLCNREKETSYPLWSRLPGRNGRCRARATRRRWRPPLSPLPPSSRLFPPQNLVSKCPSEPPFAVSPSQPPRPLRAPLRQRGSAGASWSGTGSTPTTSRMKRRRNQGFALMSLGFSSVICVADWCDLSGVFFFLLKEERRRDRRGRRRSGRGEEAAEASVVAPSKATEPRETHKLLQVWTQTVPVSMFWCL